MTIVGDIAQATGPWAPTKWKDVLAQFPSTWSSEEVELTIGYRTPAEAMALAANVLKETKLDLTPPQPVRESGEQPLVLPTNDIGKETVAAVQSECQIVDDGTVGVVVANSLVDVVGRALKDANVEHGDVNNHALDSQVTLLAADMAKGLEFDSVIVVEPWASSLTQPTVYAPLRVANAHNPPLDDRARRTVTKLRRSCVGRNPSQTARGWLSHQE